MIPIATIDDIVSAIKLIKNKRVHIDEIPVTILKEDADLFAYPLMLLFNQSITASVFPAELNRANITPIHKTGSIDDMNNYQPISKLSVYSKQNRSTCEKIFVKYVYMVLQKKSKHSRYPKQIFFIRLF